jgi:nucleotide-binding universal stress UspA family protein
MFRTVLVPLDGTYLGERAVRYAVPLARAWAARLVLYHSTPPTTLAEHAADERAAALELEALAADVSAHGLETETIVDHTYHGPVSHAITEAASARGADLIVMATHGGSGVEDALIGSAAERVARDAGIPVLVVPAARDRPWPNGIRVLLPLDGSALAEAALGPARAVVAAFDGILLLARFVPPESVGDDGTTAPLAESRAYVERVARGLRAAGLPVEVLVQTGAARAAVSATAEAWRADLIVMASHARHGLTRLALGSTTGATLRSAGVAVLVVPATAPHG